MYIISARVTDEERLARYKSLKLNETEEKELLAYDKACEKGLPTEYDLDDEKAKIAQKFAHTGTRRTPTSYKFPQKARKPNATKGGIIEEIAIFFEKNSQFSVENLQILNKERQISFVIGGETYELTLVQKRKSKK